MKKKGLIHSNLSTTVKNEEREEQVMMVPFTKWSRNKVWDVANPGSDFTLTKPAAQTLI